MLAVADLDARVGEWRAGGGGDGRGRCDVAEDEVAPGEVTISNNLTIGPELALRVEVDDALAEQFPQSIIKSGDKFLLPFAVSQTSTESELIPLTVDQQGFAEKYLDYQTVENMEQLVAVIMGNIPGHELWKYLAIAAVLIILAESFVSRWIAQQRKLGTVQEVEFVSEGERLSTFQTRANELLKTTRSKS